MGMKQEEGLGGVGGINGQERQESDSGRVSKRASDG